MLISILVVFASTVAFETVVASSAKPRPLRDGFVIAGVDGKLISADSNELPESRHIGFGELDGWLFKPDSELSDDKGVIKSGSAVELLPSATLEKIVTDAKRRSARSYRIWGIVTQYKDKNFIFPVYFLPLSKVQEEQSGASQKPQQKPEGPRVNEPNDALTIPKEIIAKLETRKIMPVEQPIEPSGTQIELAQDFILADRTAVLVEQSDGYGLFALDAFGRNTGRISLQLLPCQALELVQKQQSAESERLRFKIAGRVTKYKGQYYLLLQRAIQVYSHGNF